MRDRGARRYLTTVTTINAAAAALGYTATRYLPPPIAALIAVAAVTAAATAPFITPLPPPEDTRP